MKRGFTLIELMVVVAIISILAASAIPFLYRATMRSRSTEAAILIASIRSSQLAYHGRNDTFVECAPAPDDSPGSAKRPWADPSGEYTNIGFAPIGQLYFSYWTRINAGGTAFNIGARADLDLDTVSQYWGFMYPAADGTIAPFPWDVPIIREKEVRRLNSLDRF